MKFSWLHSTGYGQTKTVLLTRYWKIGTRLWLNRNFLIIFVKMFCLQKTQWFGFGIPRSVYFLYRHFISSIGVNNSYFVWIRIGKKYSGLHLFEIKWHLLVFWMVLMQYFFSLELDIFHWIELLNRHISDSCLISFCEIMILSSFQNFPGIVP